MKSNLSKTQFIKGSQCPLALWNYLFRKDLKPEIDLSTQEGFETGDEVGILAQNYFGDGVQIEDKFWEVEKAEKSTRDLVKSGGNLIFEATAIHPETGDFSRIDVFRKVPGTDQWDMIEVKSSTEVKEYHLDDVAFQHYVFTAAGYKIRKAQLMFINNKYERNGDINLAGLFSFEDLTEEVLLRQDSVAQKAKQLGEILCQKEPPKVRIGLQCFSPFACDYIQTCWADVPEYSIFNIMQKKKAFVVAHETGSYEIKGLSEEHIPGGKKVVDYLCHLSGEEHVSRDDLEGFLGRLEYPLYFLDYETINPAIPLFNGTRPYQQIPFQFSLHVIGKSNGEMEHFEYLHRGRSDPRAGLVKSLVENCGTLGSVIVYNQAFEEGCNKALAEAFPEFSEAILAINHRMVDLLIPFRNRFLYHPSQNGSASIKSVLPAFTNLGYGGLDIQEGGTASTLYCRYQKGKLSEDEASKMFDGLFEYCALDTLAMVELLRVLRGRIL